MLSLDQVLEIKQWNLHDSSPKGTQSVLGQRDASKDKML